MRACLTALVALLVCAASGCANFNFLKRKSDCDCTDALSCTKAADSCTQPVGCAAPVGCAQPIGCTAAVSPAGVSPAVPLAAAPAGVSPYDPGVAPYAPAPYAPAGYGGYGGGYPRHVKHRPNPYGNQGGAVVGYPYYTTRGPRDFLLDNPPSIGR
jgi:hypothetical protein